MPNDFWASVLFSLAPTVLLGLVFWFIMRAIFRADRGERAAYAKIEAEERAKAGLPPAPARVAAQKPATPEA